MAEPNSWHLSKSVPVTLILALIVQAGAIFYAGGQMRADIDSNTSNIVRQEKDIIKIEAQFHDADVKLGKIESTMEAVNKSLQRIERLLEQ